MVYSINKQMVTMEEKNINLKITVAKYGHIQTKMLKMLFDAIFVSAPK